jgi:diguanylate cyclase (GGDEF)-like protein
MLLNVASAYLFVSILVTTFFSAFIRSRSQLPYVKAIFLLSLAIDFYMYGYAGEINASTLESMIFWNHVQYIGIPFVSALWLTIALIYTEHFYPLKWWKLIYVFGIPALTFFFRMTNGWYHLYFTELYVVTIDGATILAREKGLWYYVQALHSISMVMLSAFLYLTYFIKNRKQDTKRVQYMLIASVIAVLGVLLNLLKNGDVTIDFMVLLLPMTVVVVLMGIFRHDFLEIKILARETVFENSTAGMLLMDPDHRVLDFNKAAEEFFLQKGMHIKVGKLETEDTDFLQTFYSEEPVTWREESDQGVQFYEISSIHLPNAGGHYGTLKTIRNVTEKQLLLDNLRLQATVDELSGLLNRRAFMSLAKASIALFEKSEPSKNQIFLLMMDIDFFKRVNDTFGHIIGDRVIQEIGHLLKSKFRESDLVGRVGGEEFAVFMEVRTLEDALNRAEDFRKAVEAMAVQVGDLSLRVTISIGISRGAGEAPYDISTLMSHADHALYASKENGRNRTTIFKETTWGQTESK